jgi:hypothetical protein
LETIMAIHAPITGAPTRAPSIDRRNLLGALAAAPAIAALAVPAAAAPASRFAWQRARRDLEQARARMKAALDDYNAADMAHHLFAKATRPTGLRKLPGVPVEVQAMTLDKSHFRALYTFEASDMSDAEIMDLWDVVARYRESLKAEATRLRLEALNTEVDAAIEHLSAAERAVVVTPSPDADALLFKIGLSEEVDADDLFMDALASDVRRLAGRA